MGKIEKQKVRECERSTESVREEKPEEISSDRFVSVAFDKNKYFVEKLQQHLFRRKMRKELVWTDKTFP